MSRLIFIYANSGGAVLCKELIGYVQFMRTLAFPALFSHWQYETDSTLLSPFFTLW